MLRTILFGTGTNYLRVIVRLVTGFVTYRLIYKSLGDADFGIYQTLWQSLGMMLLLDFGFGFSVQRAMARADGRGDDPLADVERREAISTVFWGYVAMAALVAALTAWGGRELLGTLFTKQGEGPTRAHVLASAVFAAGTLIAFPFGIYREALRGQNRLHVANLIDLACTLLQTVALVWGCLHGWGFFGLMTATTATSVVPPMAMAVVAMRSPSLRPDPRRFRLGRLRELSGFSVYAYGITTTNTLMAQTDNPIISWLVGLHALKLVYSPGQKLAAMYYLLAAQMQDTLGPIAARIDAGGAHDRIAALRSLLLNSQRWSVMVAAPMVLPLVLATPAAVRLITSEHEPNAAMLHNALVLLAATVVATLTVSCAKRILVMIGHHRALLAMSIAEAVGGVGLGVALTWSSGNAIGVSVGRLESAAIAMVLVPAYACRALDMPISDFVRAIGRGLVGSIVPAVVGVAYWGWHHGADGEAHEWHTAISFALGTGLVAMAMPVGWWFGGMLPEERQRVRAAIRDHRARRRARSQVLADALPQAQLQVVAPASSPIPMAAVASPPAPVDANRATAH